MRDEDAVNILLVDDQPAKLLSYEVILQGLGQNLIKTSSASEALEQLLKTEIAVVLVDVSMPQIDGFQLASMIREHPRFERTAIIFVSAIHFTDIDRVRGYEMGAVDYVPVPVIPEVLRAKVRIFVELYRKTRQLEQMNDELERRVAERTAELQASTERQAILAREVDHRAKNALAVVQSIVRLTQAPDVASYVESVEGRISALSRAHSLLSDSRWEGASLGRLVEEELAPYQPDRNGNRVTVKGPAVLLQPSAAQTLALALHELATNAAKYGALSTPEGKLSITWTLKPDRLLVTWREADGPAVINPATRGFGTRLIRASVEGQLGGKTSFDWDPDGLTCTLAIPRGEQLEPSRASAAAFGEKGAGPQAASGSPPRRALLVEDEALVGMMLADLLADLGFTVVGPFTRVSDALAATREEAIDVAVLDLNLRGEMSYPVADALASRDIPFVFVTGYGRDRIDRRYAEAQVLQKPIQRHELQAVFAKVRRGTERAST